MPEETYKNDGIECPYCGYVEDDGEVIYDTEIETFDCPSCERKMNASASISWTFEASERTVEDIDAEIELETRNGLNLIEVSESVKERYKDRNPYQHKIDSLEKEKEELINYLREK